MRAIQLLRSLVFYGLFLGQTVILAIIVGTIALFSGMRRTRLGFALGKYWGRSNLWLLRWVVGIRTEVEGGETIPHGPCIVAAKHQSDWDIFAILPHTVRPAFIAKAELMNIPFFGWAARSIDTIRIERALGAQAIPAMLESARAALARGCQIIIFPEGTRKLPLADPDYRQGIVRMYEALNVPVIPVAVSSGVFWSRNSLILWPGIARAKVLPAIPPGLDAETFRTRLVADIEGATTSLIRTAVSEGLGRPVPESWRDKLG
jgi:1-acyl-sn-glycerol-3-phosphate acyltransferase